MADPWQECMDFAVTLARQAGEVVREALHFPSSRARPSLPLGDTCSCRVSLAAFDREYGERRTVVGDVPAHALVQCCVSFLLLQSTSPYNLAALDNSFIGEESVAAGEQSVLTDNPTWIIDPIDGTTNFVHRLAVGRESGQQMEFGVVYSCVEDKMYTGRRGQGAFCNGLRLQVSRQEGRCAARVARGLQGSRRAVFQHSTQTWNNLFYLTRFSLRQPVMRKVRDVSLPGRCGTSQSDVLRECRTVRKPASRVPVSRVPGLEWIRGVGTAAVNMCLVASGAADAYYEMGIHCWDMAGAGIIVTEAGGVLMDVTGGPFDLMSRRVIAAGSKTLAERIAKEIQVAPFQRDDAD
ncbi:PREDICTED: inositol monophosphatase 1 [Hipposideros armiger]|uniref:Inositol-1-monophosphatase n=1 Tax=Hipposideros armiger TaxID=186990 RepID=A0A8B7S395_HIPAR|nr:PREDICTED: inositol monophosphatase 1 [Hipposideros armiger]